MSTPNEVYRKDLVSAMTVTDLPDCHQFFYLADNWKTEWERGVQVPAKAKQKKAHVVELESAPQPPIKPPKSRPRYSLDNLDVAWLERANQHRVAASLPTLTEDDLETIIDEFETQANSTIRQKCSNKTVKSMEDNSVCDVCRSPNGEDGNELVFCDGCDICVHQHCYGILKIDDGEDWFCQPCKENLKPKCYLCSQHGGTMKRAIGWERVATSAPWVHIQCALWIPEITMTDPARMEKPDISQLPESRKSLKCTVCSNTVGCVQCNIKKCYKSYHVTCAVRSGLSVKMETKGGRVNLFLHCDKHSETKLDEVRKRRTSIDQQVDEERRFLEENFFTLVSLEHAKNRLTSYSMDTLDWVFEYWRLRRRAGGNQQLFNDNDVEPEAATAEQRYRRITQLRSDLERSRNLLCLIIRREKIKKQVLRCDREIKLKEMKFLGSKVELSESTKSDLKRMDMEFIKAGEKPKTEADDAAAFLEDLDAPPEPVKKVPIPTQPPKPSPKPAPSANAIITNRPPPQVKVESKSAEQVEEAKESKPLESKTEPVPVQLKKETTPEVIPQPVKGTPIKGFNMKNAVSVGQFKVVQGKSKILSGNARPLKGFIRPTNPSVSQAQLNSPRMNGPSMDGKTVIGTKVVGGQNQPVIMESSPGFRMTRPPVVSVPSQIRMRSTPPNIMITPKMVGGKEVRLVTPSFPKPKPGSRARLVRPEVRPQSNRPDAQTPQVRNTPPASLPAQATPPPVQHSSQHPAHQQQGPSFQARTPVRGDASKAPNTPPVSKANVKPGLIKLGAFAKGAKPAMSAQEPKEAAPEEISTRQLTEQLLKVDPRRRSLGKSDDKAPAMNNATKEIFDKFKKLDSENKPSPKPADKKKSSNRGISFGNLFKKDSKSETGNMMNKFKNIFNSTKSKQDSKKKLTPYQKAKQKQSTTVLPLKPTRIPQEVKKAKSITKTEQAKAEIRARKPSTEVNNPADDAKVTVNGTVQEKIQEVPKENGLPIEAKKQEPAPKLDVNDSKKIDVPLVPEKPPVPVNDVNALNEIPPEEQIKLCQPLKVLVDRLPNDSEKAADIINRSACLSPKRKHSLDHQGPPSKQSKKETNALDDVAINKAAEMPTKKELEAPKIDACPIMAEPVSTLTPPQAADEPKRGSLVEGLLNGSPKKVDLTARQAVKDVEIKTNEQPVISSNKLPLSPPDEPDQQKIAIPEVSQSVPPSDGKENSSEIVKTLGIEKKHVSEENSGFGPTLTEKHPDDKAKKPEIAAPKVQEKLPSSPENEDDDLPLDSLVRRDSSKKKDVDPLDDLFQPAIETPVFDKPTNPLAKASTAADKAPSIFPNEALFSSMPPVSTPISAPLTVTSSSAPILPATEPAIPVSSAASSEFNPLDELFGTGATAPSTSSKDSICDSFNPLDDIFGSSEPSTAAKSTGPSTEFNITDFIDLDQPLPPPKVLSEQDMMKTHAMLANIKSEPIDPNYFSQPAASAPPPVPTPAPLRRPSSETCPPSSKAAPAVPPILSPSAIPGSLPASAPPNSLLSESSALTNPSVRTTTTTPHITPSNSTGLISSLLKKPIDPVPALNTDNSSFQDIIKSMVQGVHTLNDKETLARHVSMLIQQAQPSPQEMLARAQAQSMPVSMPQPSSSSMSKLQALLASPIEPFPQNKVNPFGGLHLLNSLKSPPSSSAESKAPFPSSLPSPAQVAAAPKMPQVPKAAHPNIVTNPKPPAKRKNSTTRSEQVRKKLTDLPRFNPPKKQQKIIYSPTASSVQVFETPTEVITIKPENEKFSESKKKQARKISDEAYRPGIAPKRARTKSPSRRSRSPRKGGESPSKSPYKLPKIKIARNQKGEADGKWRIEPVFVCSVPESEIDCTALLDKLSKRRSSVAPPPLQRAPGATNLRFEIKKAPDDLVDSKQADELEKKPIKITLRVPKINNNQSAGLLSMPPPPSGLRTTPRKGASAVKYTDPWWDDS